MKYLLITATLFFSADILSQTSDVSNITAIKDTIQPPIELAKYSDLLPEKKTETVQLTDTIFQEPKLEKFTDSDLKRIDSLLVASKFNSPLFNTNDYVINDADIVGNIESIVTSDVLKARLSEINTTTPFHLEYNPALEKVINNYVKYRKKYFPALMARAKYYFPMFEQYLDQYNIPLEMKYLAIVESALNPRAKSRVGATGLWQFMYGTGRQFKLAVNSYVDERQDPIKATVAACKYLNELYNRFNDWDLALAAYNSGPGNVLKAIKRSGGYRNYWNIRPYLPMETAGYVPAFYATMYIFKYANELGVYSKAPDMYNFQTDTIRVKHTISFDQVSQKTGISDEILSFLNPQYKIDIIPLVKSKAFSIRIPRNKTIDFLNKEQEIYALATTQNSTREKPLAKYFEMDRGIRYRVRSGDYLGKIAKKFGVRVSQLKRWNNMRNTKLKIGQRLKVYPRKM